MNEIPPIGPLITRDQRKIDADHLNLLAIFHCIGAGLALLGILFLLAHFLFMHALFENPKMWQNQKQGPPPAELFAIFKWVYAVAGVWFAGSAILNIISGIFLFARKYRTFSLVVGGLNCLHMPLGMALGVFTIIVLMRDSVRERYETK